MTDTTSQPSPGDGADEAEGYQIYIRLPVNSEELSADEVRRKLERFASLLTDHEKKITVQTFAEYVDDEGNDGGNDGGNGGGNGGKGAGEDGEDSGEYVTYKKRPGLGRPLIPAIVCHNRT